jgi:hypothetical protein
VKVRRLAFAAGAAVFASLVLADLVTWRAFAWLPIALYGAILCSLAVFERGRYRPVARVTDGEPSWRPTGERFYDPASGVATEVFDDPRTGAREYRTAN